MPDLTKDAIRELRKVDHLVTTDQPTLDRAAAALVPEDYRVESLERFHTRPFRIRQCVTLQSIESFIDYVRVHHNDYSVIFFDEDKMLAEFVADYHDTRPSPQAPDWCSHRAVYQAVYDERWVKWLKSDNEYMTQIELAHFIEQRVKDFVVPKDHPTAPSGTDMLTLATDFVAKKDVVYSKGVNLANGDIQFQYSSKDHKGTMEVPSEFFVGIPLFKNNQPYVINARFRYRLVEDQLRFRFELMHLEDIRRFAVDAMLDELRKLSSLRVFLGSITTHNK